MNIVNAVNGLRDMVAVLPSDLRQIALACMESPIFDLTDFGNPDNVIDREAFLKAPLPFPAYRCFFPNSKRWALFLRRGDVVSGLSLHLYDGSDYIVAISHVQYSADLKEIIATDLFLTNIEGGKVVQLYRADRDSEEFLNDFQNICDAEDGAGVSSGFVAAEQRVLDFAFFFTAGMLALPGRFLATKSEKRHFSRPVEWQRCHQRYIILDKRHEANSKAVKHGAVVHSNSAKALVRTAHSRRAHSRMLSSDRFKAKRGQRVPVKSSWVGPNEWCDGSNQVYKILI